MVSTPWCTEKDVAPLLSFQQGANWNESDIKERISRAERAIKAKLLAAYGAATISAWTSTTVPAVIKDIAAAWAAMLIKKDYMADYKTSDVEKESTYRAIDDLTAGKSELFDSTGAIIARLSNSSVLSNSGSRTKTFTSYHPDHSDYGKGSLDEFGPATPSDSNYPGENA